MEWWQILLIVLGGLLVLFVLSIIFYKPFFKRFWDIVLSGLAFLILSIALIFVSIGVFVSVGKPVLYVSKRATKNKKTFHLLKFRSMKNITDRDGIPLADSKRITKFGSFIRKTSLDEFPQLINVLTGKMSLVGPRPYLPREREDMENYYDTIIKVKPGITGYWQIQGRSGVTFKDRLEMDRVYVEKRSLKLDAQLLIKTLIEVVKKEGAV